LSVIKLTLNGEYVLFQLFVMSNQRGH